MSDRLDQLDYYTLLRIEADVSSDRVREAFHEFARRYHPDRFAGAPEAKRARAAEIYRRGAEGYRVLMNPQARRSYDIGLDAGKLRLTATQERESLRPTSSTKLDIRSPRARPFVAKAHQALKSGDYKTAKLNLKMALGFEPKNALLEARLAAVERMLASE